MGIWTPSNPVLSNLVLELNRGNPCNYLYTLPGNQQFPTGTTSLLTLKDTSGNILGQWEGTISGGTINIVEPHAVTDLIPAGTSWTLATNTTPPGEPTLLAQGTVVRNEAPFPTQSPQNNLFNGVDYSYTFATAGMLSDPTWTILSGTPVVYNNSSLQLPNAVAAGALTAVLLDGTTVGLNEALPWETASMLYYAPLPTDAVSLSYNVVKGLNIGGGETWIIVSSAYDMNTCVAFYHQQWIGGTNTVGIATGSGPTNGASATAFDIQESVTYTTETLDNFIATYNPVTNTYALYVFGNTTPLVTWTDSGNLIPHGPGFRYVGFVFKSGLLAPGVEISDWIINQGVATPSAVTWAATTSAPTAAAVSGKKATLVFPQPASPTGTYSYAVTQSDSTTGVVGPATLLSTAVSGGNVTLTVEDLNQGDSVTFTVTVTATLADSAVVTATSLPTTAITVLA